MFSFLLTKSDTFIIGPVATVLGYVMNGIFYVLNAIGIPNIGLSIVIMTIIIYMALLPLTIRQQKFSKLQSKMQPKIQAINKKYEGKKDPDSVQRQQDEMQAVYREYGVNPMGSCLQLVIQLPILFALYRVIANFPAYVPMVREAFYPLVEKLAETNNAAEYLQQTKAASQFASQFTNENFVNGTASYVQNTFIDVLNKFSTAEWSELAEKFTDLSDEIASTSGKLAEYNNFLGLNIANSPWFMLKEAFAVMSIIGIIAAVIIPILSAVTQLISIRLSQANTQGSTGNEQMESTMRSMNVMMPIMSAWFCLTLPAGMGIYWIAGAVVRSIQQVFVNRHVDRIDYDALIAKNKEKAKEKDVKRGKAVSKQTMSQYSGMSTKNLSKNDKYSTKISAENEKKLEEIRSNQKNIKSDSLLAKVNMVQDFNNYSKDNQPEKAADQSSNKNRKNK